MTSKKILKVFGGASVLTLLSGCLQTMPSNEPAESLGPDQVQVHTTSNQLSDAYYRAVIIDGRYQLAITDSQDASYNARGDTQAFEEGLLNISKQIFPTDQYYLQEGQLIDEETMTQWVSRESETNPTGLNPALPDIQEDAIQEEDTESTAPGDQPEDPENPEDPNNPGTEEAATDEPADNQVLLDVEVAPLYLDQIMEKNLMIETEEGFALSGVVIGLSMNTEYVFTDNQGTVYQQQITTGEVRERGRQYANIIVSRLRNTEELRSIPIVIGIYASPSRSDIIGGHYILHGISREGNAISEWHEHNEFRIALPAINSDIPLDQTAYFEEFKAEVENFFPNLNGISGEALYIDNGLADLSIEIVTQFYLQSEIVALTQYVNDVAQRMLPEGVDIDIKILSSAGMEAVLHKPAHSSQYNTIVIH